LTSEHAGNRILESLSVPLVRTLGNHAILQWDCFYGSQFDQKFYRGKESFFFSRLLDTGLSALGGEVIGCQLVASFEKGLFTSDIAPLLEEKRVLSGSQRRRLKGQIGTIKSSIHLDVLLTEMEAELEKSTHAEELFYPSIVVPEL
jgi:hypothetical protein